MDVDWGEVDPGHDGMILHVQATESKMFPNGSMWWYSEPPLVATPGDLTYDESRDVWQVWDGVRWVALK